MIRKSFSGMNSRAAWALLHIFILLLGIAIGYMAFGRENTVVVQKQDVPVVHRFVFGGERYASSGHAVMLLPAVMRNDTGVSARVIVAASKGTGEITMNMNNVLVAPETQQSLRIAALVAGAHEGIDMDTIDLNYDIYADASSLEGPSAGAAFAIATIAAMENRSIRKDVMMTGTVNHDGTVGPAGKILEKAKAAKDAGATHFLVPVGASKELNYTESEFCHTWGTYNYCQLEFVPEEVLISEEAGIDVVEVRTIEEALTYFLS